MNINNLKNMYTQKAYGKIDGEYRWKITNFEIKEAEKPDNNGEINAYVLLTGVLNNDRPFNKTLFSDIDNNAFMTAVAYACGKTNGEATANELIDELLNSDLTLGVRIETIAKKNAIGEIKRFTNIYYTDVPTAVIQETTDDGVTIIE